MLIARWSRKWLWSGKEFKTAFITIIQEINMNTLKWKDRHSQQKQMKTLKWVFYNWKLYLLLLSNHFAFPHPLPLGNFQSVLCMYKFSFFPFWKVINYWLNFFDTEYIYYQIIYLCVSLGYLYLSKNRSVLPRLSNL